MSRSRLLHSTLASVATAAVLVTLAACGGDGSTAPAATLSDAQITGDIAAQVGDGVAASTIEFDVEQSIATTGGGSCPLAAGSTTLHRCARTSANGLAFERSYEFLDASLTPRAQYDANTTASIDFLLSVDGTVTRPQFAAAIHRRHARTVSGLAGAETQRVWNGTATVRDTTTHTGERATRRYVVATTETTTNVVVGVPRSANAYPLSGSVTRVMNIVGSIEGAARSAQRTVSRTATVTFNGTANVPLRIGAASCMLNLDTRTVDGCTGL